MEKQIIVGITIGDPNGIGPEIIIKTFNDNRLLDFITPEQDKLRQKIMELYQTYLHREPDITDLNYWEEKIFEGKSIPWIEEQMRNSEEGLNYYN